MLQALQFTQLALPHGLRQGLLSGVQCLLEAVSWIEVWNGLVFYVCLRREGIAYLLLFEHQLPFRGGREIGSSKDIVKSGHIFCRLYIFLYIIFNDALLHSCCPAFLSVHDYLCLLPEILSRIDVPLALQPPKELLSVTPDLGTAPCADVILNTSPVFGVQMHT